MSRTIACLVLILAMGCKSGADEAREEIAAQQKKEAAEKAADEASRPPPVVKVEIDAAPPEPTTPEEIDKARKQAMIDGRDKDVIKYCEMQKVDAKSDPQILLGCTLAACRTQDVDKAKAWSAPLTKELKGEAVRICKASNVGL